MLIICFLILLLTFLSMWNFKSWIEYNNKNNINMYECSYNNMNYMNMMYSSQFFILALSFMLFDLEIVFFLPYFIMYYFSSFIVYMLMFFFFFLMFSLYFELMQKII